MSLILSSLPNDILEPSYHVIMKLIVISKCNKRWLGGGKNTQSLKCYANYVIASVRIQKDRKGLWLWSSSK